MVSLHGLRRIECIRRVWSGVDRTIVEPEPAAHLGIGRVDLGHPHRVDRAVRLRATDERVAQVEQQHAKRQRWAVRCHDLGPLARTEAVVFDAEPAIRRVNDFGKVLERIIDIRLRNYMELEGNLDVSLQVDLLRDTFSG